VAGIAEDRETEQTSAFSRLIKERSERIFGTERILIKMRWPFFVAYRKETTGIYNSARTKADAFLDEKFTA